MLKLIDLLRQTGEGNIQPEMQKACKHPIDRCTGHVCKQHLDKGYAGNPLRCTEWPQCLQQHNLIIICHVLQVGPGEREREREIHYVHSASLAYEDGIVFRSLGSHIFSGFLSCQCSMHTFPFLPLGRLDRCWSLLCRAAPGCQFWHLYLVSWGSFFFLRDCD